MKEDEGIPKEFRDSVPEKGELARDRFWFLPFRFTHVTLLFQVNSLIGKSDEPRNSLNVSSISRFVLIGTFPSLLEMRNDS